jgi:hypothetical protein
MHIEDFLRPSDVTVDMSASDKVRLLRELARQAAAKLNLPSDRAADALLKRGAGLRRGPAGHCDPARAIGRREETVGQIGVGVG